MSPIYRIIVIGDEATGIPAAIKTTIVARALEFGIHDGQELEFVNGASASPSLSASVAVFIGANPSPKFSLPWLTPGGIPIIPVVSDLKKCAVELPPELHPLNAMELKAKGADDAIASAVLECLGLLHRQRRVFVSYVRDEAKDVALQLFDDLSKRQFDVFLDTHDVRPGEEFQAVLWHRLCDSDVMVMLDTPSYFGRRWTRVEYGKASLKKAAILRVAWPTVSTAPSLGATDTVLLAASDFSGPQLAASALDRVGDQIERLRSISIAARHANLVGTIRAAVTNIKGKFIGIGPRRRVEIELPGGKRVLAYSIVGVPTAETLHEVAIESTSSSAIVYDHLGVHERWLKHLGWLGDNFPGVRWIQAAELGWDLIDWDSE